MSRRFRVAELQAEAGGLALDGAASHHLLRVLRARPGHRVELFDGAGRRATATLVEVVDGRAWLDVEPSREAVRPPRLLIQGLPRKPAWERVLRMATELGVTEVRGVGTARSVVEEPRAERWERLVEAAAAQCGRADLPAVTWVPSLTEALQDLPPGRRGVLVPGAATAGGATCTSLLLGPEGGLTDAEVATARDLGFQALGLGDLTLRADTAAAAALARYALLQGAAG